MDPFTRPLRYDSSGYTTLTPADTVGDRLCGPQSASGGPTVPEDFVLHQNYPNPFNPTTEIRFSLERASVVTVEIVNLLGQRVELLLEHAARGAGEHRLTFDASRYPSGLYLCRLTAGSRSAVRKLLLLK